MKPELPPLPLCDECEPLGYCKERRKEYEASKRKTTASNIPETAPLIEAPVIHEGGIMVCGRIDPF